MKYIIFIFAFFFDVHCFAYSTKVDSLNITIGGKKINQLLVTIQNDTDEPLYLWVDTLSYTKDVQDKYIWHFFNKRRGDFSILNIVCEANIIYPERFWLFFKVLFPNESFIFAFDRNADKDECETFSREKTLSSIRAFSKSEIKSAFQQLIDERAFRLLAEVISYPFDFIAIPYNMLSY